MAPAPHDNSHDDHLWLCVLALPALACLAGGFIWTDGGEILDGSLIAGSWRELVEATVHGIPGAYYRPLVQWLHSVTVWMFGADPLAFRLTNYVLHVVNVLLGYSLARAVSVPRSTALGGFALFAVHPLVATPISWAGDRTDLMALMGALACLLCWVAFVRTDRVAMALGSCLALLLGLMAKETAACAVLVASVALVDSVQWRRRLPCWGALAAIAGGWFAWRTWLKTDNVSEVRSWSSAERIATAIQIHWDYALELLVPSRLRACDSTVIPDQQVLLIGSGLVMTGLIAWAVWRWSRQEVTWKVLALIWLVAFLIPTSGLISLKHIRADRYLYCVLPALTLLAVGALSSLSSRKVQLIVSGCYLYFAVGLILRSPTLHSDEALWEREVSLHPGCREGWAYLGAAALARNDSARAASHYERALAQDARNISFTPRADVLQNLGVCYTNLGQFELARERLRQALDSAGTESSTAGSILYQWALSHVAEENCRDALPLLKRVRAIAVTSSLSFDNDLLLGFCTAREGGDRELLSTLQVGLRRLDLAHLSPSRRGMAEAILRAK